MEFLKLTALFFFSILAIGAVSCAAAFVVNFALVHFGEIGGGMVMLFFLSMLMAAIVSFD